MLLLDKQVEFSVLRESIRARITVAAVSIVGTFFSIFLFIPFLISQGVSDRRIALWVVPIALLMLARAVFSRRRNMRLDLLTNTELVKVDRTLRVSSILNQFAVGTGIWIMQSASSDPFVLPLFMTLVVVIWSIGVLANLFSDFRTCTNSVSRN